MARVLAGVRVLGWLQTTWRHVQRWPLRALPPLFRARHRSLPITPPTVPAFWHELGLTYGMSKYSHTVLQLVASDDPDPPPHPGTHCT